MKLAMVTGRALLAGAFIFCLEMTIHQPPGRWPYEVGSGLAFGILTVWRQP